MRRTVYPKAIFWSGMAAVAVALLAYTIGFLAVINSTGGQAFVADSCLLTQEPYQIYDEPVLDYEYLTENRSLLPLSAPCNPHHELVPSYSNPVFFTGLSLGLALLTARFVVWYRSVKPSVRES